MIFLYRVATIDDIPALAKHVSEEISFAPPWQMTPDPDGIQAHLEELVTQKCNTLSLATTYDGEIAGGLALAVVKAPYFKESYLQDRAFFVRPQFRRSEVARNLLRWAKTIADQNGMPLLLGQISGLRVKALDRLYECMGLMRVGSNFLYTR